MGRLLQGGRARFAVPRIVKLVWVLVGSSCIREFADIIVQVG